jgi:hypothetical protein
MRHQFNDGGRAAAGFKPAGDCVTRAIAIVTGLPYMDVYNALSEGVRTERRSPVKKRTRGTSARDGVRTTRKWFSDYITGLGFRWVPTMAIGQGCKVHLREDELPKGRLIVNCSKHFTAVIDGTIHDTYNPDRGGTRCVYGYYVYEGPVHGPKWTPETKAAALASLPTTPPKGGNLDPRNWPELQKLDDEADAMNLHLDNDHAGDPQADCPICKEYGWA